MAAGVVPHEAARRERHRIRAGEVVSGVPVFVRVVVRVGLVAPLMAERALIARRVIVVEQDELFGERMEVRRHGPAEDGEVRRAVALRHVAEHLIVGSILLDDVDDVTNR